MSFRTEPAAANDPVPRVRGMYQILPYCYMGDADSACTNKDELKRLGITHIINAASEDVDNMFPEDFAYTAFPLEDRHDAEPNAHFNETFDVLNAVKESNGSKKALIFDVTGKNVSPTLLLAYMMMSAKKQEKHLPLAQAIKFVQAKAPGSNPSEQFLAQLVELEVELFEDASVKVRGMRSGNSRDGRGGKGRRGK